MSTPAVDFFGMQIYDIVRLNKYRRTPVGFLFECNSNLNAILKYEIISDIADGS